MSVYKSSMRVVHINFDATGWGGASIAMYRIHTAMRRQGIDSIIACREDPKWPDARQLPMGRGRRIVVFGSRVLMKLAYGHVYRSCLVKTGMADFVNSMNPDKVVLHWLHIDAIGLREIPKIKAPIEWWLHDLWPMSGTVPYPETEWFKKGEPSENWVSRRSWRLKCETVRRIKDRLTVVGPSEWVCKEARESVVFRGATVSHEPYPMDPDFAAEAARQERCLSRDRFVILFGAVGGTQNSIKGFDRLMAAVAILPQEIKPRIQINVFGETHADEIRDGVKLHYLGELKGSRSLVAAYKSAHVFAFPSRRETWGQVKSEALLCGCPVVAFDETACAEGVRHEENGWIARPDDWKDFAQGLLYFMVGR